ncbi:class I SAM-dependent methyltransferase [Gryllotalpicola reticulitermitis]|uniref:Class I SAM-dependent methyltransferase n=1 Tax=Gryllotalpicola reticulitermitis TaxID=1184153 RepID=A0ABV8Q7S5_9MICO
MPAAHHDDASASVAQSHAGVPVAERGAIPADVIGSASLDNKQYWWYTVRSELLERVFRRYVPIGGRVLDVGSADAPSSAWMGALANKTSMDLDPRGLDLEAGDVVGSVTDIPFADQTFDVVSAFDVIEHVVDEHRALDEIYRLLKPGGYLLMAVPTYQWAWSSHDVASGHVRRYVKGRAIDALVRSGFNVVRTTYAFAGVFPFFAAERLGRKLTDAITHKSYTDENAVPVLPQPSPWQNRLLLGASRLDAALIARTDLPFGSSFFAAAQKPATQS